jgi:DNA-binding transcriptional LysR family regulator
LKYAIEVERVGSISKAAEKFYMSQPHLSKTIRELEGALDIVIFKRTSTGMVPTKKGAKFLTYAKSILTQVDTMMESLVSKDSLRKTAFNIVVPRASYIAYAFTEFIKNLPPDRVLAVDYRETNSVSAVHDVADGENDLGIVRFPVEYENYFVDFLREKDLNFEPIFRFEYLALLSKDHPLAGEDPIDPLKFEDYIEIVHGDTNVPSLLRVKGHSHNKKRDRKEIAVYERASQLELLKRVPSTYMWVSPMPEGFLTVLGLVQRRCDMPKNYQKDLLVYRNNYYFTNEDRRFISQLKETVKAISII